MNNWGLKNKASIRGENAIHSNVHVHIFQCLLEVHVYVVQVNLLLNYLLNIILHAPFTPSFHFGFKQTLHATVCFLYTGVQCKVASLPGSKGSTNIVFHVLLHTQVVVSCVGIYTVQCTNLAQ